MLPVIALLLGTALALAFVGLARRYPPGRERRVYAVGLVAAALVYVGFGAAGGAGARWLALEILGVLLYGAAAWAGLRGRAWLLAAGWAAHVGWDVLLHLSGAGAEYTPGSILSRILSCLHERHVPHTAHKRTSFDCDPVNLAAFS